MGTETEMGIGVELNMKLTWWGVAYVNAAQKFDFQWLEHRAGGRASVNLESGHFVGCVYV